MKVWNWKNTGWLVGANAVADVTPRPPFPVAMVAIASDSDIDSIYVRLHSERSSENRLVSVGAPVMLLDSPSPTPQPFILNRFRPSESTPDTNFQATLSLDFYSEIWVPAKKRAPYLTPTGSPGTTKALAVAGSGVAGDIAAWPFFGRTQATLLIRAGAQTLSYKVLVRNSNSNQVYDGQEYPGSGFATLAPSALIAITVTVDRGDFIVLNGSVPGAGENITLYKFEAVD
jgi:hypothetical protein